jgi:hypothetical protein
MWLATWGENRQALSEALKAKDCCTAANQTPAAISGSLCHERSSTIRRILHCDDSGAGLHGNSG